MPPKTLKCIRNPSSFEWLLKDISTNLSDNSNPEHSRMSSMRNISMKELSLSNFSDLLEFRSMYANRTILQNVNDDYVRTLYICQCQDNYRFADDTSIMGTERIGILNCTETDDGNATWHKNISNCVTGLILQIIVFDLI